MSTDKTTQVVMSEQKPYYVQKFLVMLMAARNTITEQATSVLQRLDEEINDGETELINGTYFRENGPSEFSECVVGWLMRWKGIDPRVLFGTQINNWRVTRIREQESPESVKVTLNDLASVGFGDDVLKFLQKANDSKLLHDGYACVLMVDSENHSTTNERVSRAIELLMDDDEADRYYDAAEALGFDLEYLRTKAGV